MPEWVQPMAATLTQERFTHPDWLFERKFDGIRILAFKQGGDVKLYSRNRLLQNDVYPRIARAVAQLPLQQAILDGEASWRGQHAAEYQVFDVLWADHDVRALPLEERRALLAQLPLHAPLGRVDTIEHATPWSYACEQGWEGVIAKKRAAPYEHRRSKSWLKMKCELTQDFLVGGFTDPQRSRVGLGALLLGFYDGTDFVFAGKVGTGLDNAMLLALRERLNRIEIEQAPFTRASGLPRVRAHWVRPEVTVRVAFIEWTVHKKLRHPRLLSVDAAL
jgi:DNA ligase D-like protein (predicted ligase)